MSKELYKRAFVIVCDSMGIGHAEDAALFGDEGAIRLVIFVKQRWFKCN